jgi:APA family basic amino acid/polyamine antiporter
VVASTNTGPGLIFSFSAPKVCDQPIDTVAAPTEYSNRELNVAALLSLALARIPHPWLAVAMNPAVLAGLTSVMLVMLLGQSRVFCSMSRFVPITVVGKMTSIGTMFAFVLVSGGIVIMRRRSPELERPFRTPWVPLVPVASIAVNLLLMASLGWSNWTRLIVWLAIGLAIYFPRRGRRMQNGRAVLAFAGREADTTGGGRDSSSRGRP